MVFGFSFHWLFKRHQGCLSLVSTGRLNGTWLLILFQCRVVVVVGSQFTLLHQTTLHRFWSTEAKGKCSQNWSSNLVLKFYENKFKRKKSHKVLMKFPKAIKNQMALKSCKHHQVTSWHDRIKCCLRAIKLHECALSLILRGLCDAFFICCFAAPLPALGH